MAPTKSKLTRNFQKCNRLTKPRWIKSHGSATNPILLNPCLKLSPHPIHLKNPQNCRKMDKKEAARLIIPLGKTH
jgi:hypothetical protein